MFTKQELSNILALIKTAPITGEHALTVAVLQQKIAALILEIKEPEKTETVKEKKDK